jgi:hypothetical protein
VTCPVTSANPRAWHAIRKTIFTLWMPCFEAVQIFNPDGQLLLNSGEEGTKKGQFLAPRGHLYRPVRPHLDRRHLQPARAGLPVPRRPPVM